MKNIIEVDSVILEFGSSRILQDIYLKSETGKITGILGRNGTGKSCLMKIMYGEIEPLDKSIRLNGKSQLNEYRSPQDLRYLPQNLFIPKSLKIKSIFKDFKLNFDHLIMNFPEFKSFYNTRLSKLSGGEKRIIEIFTILTSQTKFCMLDEPFSQVMPIHIDSIKKLIIKEKQNKGLIITDHMYQHVSDICDDIYVISKGKTYLTNNLEDLVTLGYVRNIKN